jgi:hypothetical protein
MHKITEYTRLILQQSKLRNSLQCYNINESPSRDLNYYHDSLSKQWRNLNKLSKSIIGQQRVCMQITN